MKISVLAITKNGKEIAKKLLKPFPDSDIFIPEKFMDKDTESIKWFSEPTSKIIVDLFKNYDALVCIFSLGAVIRLLASSLSNKKDDPAVVVIDDRAKFVISTLSGHLGGANSLTNKIASFLNSTPVITTAADVNETISVDLIGRDLGWIIENFDNVTKISADMVNEEPIALYQDSGERDWWKGNLPKNVTLLTEFKDLESDRFKSCLIISDREITNQKILDKSVVYRPKSLVVGIGLHWDTTKQEISDGLSKVLKSYGLSFLSIRNFTSLDRGKMILGLEEFSKENNIPIIQFKKEELADIQVPNPSTIVRKFEGTPSVSEASSILSSKGQLIVPKQKFPPNLTIAISRVNYEI